MHEAKMHPRNSFITLTYSDEHLPWDRSVDPVVMQDFMKRLRHSVSPFKIKHFTCGEYGDYNNRPHYHSIIFNYDFADKRFYKYNKNGDPLFTSSELEQLWPFGRCLVGAVSWQSAAYVARYVMKKVTGDQAEHHYQWYSEMTGSWIRIQPEFVNMSNGIGLSWLLKFGDTDAFNQDFVILDGKKFTVPRYYLKKLKEWEEERNVSLTDSKLSKIKIGRSANRARRKANNTDDRLHVRQVVQEARISRLKREL